MPDDTERLVILVEAKVNELEKQMAKASGTTAKAYREMSTGSRRATSQMQDDAIRSTLRINKALDSMQGRAGVFASSFATGLVAPIAGMLSLTAAIHGTKEAISQFDAVAKSAKASGLDAEAFQELAYAAKLGGVEMDTFSKSLETFEKNAGLAAEGKGRMVTALKALNPELLRNIQASKSQAERIRLVADAINSEADSAKRAATATTIFGDAGTRMIEVFQGGSDALDETARKARELGLVVDSDLIAKAEEYGDAWDTAAQIIDTKVKVALLGLAPQMLWLLDRVIDLANEGERFGKAMSSPRDFFAWLGGGSGAQSRLRDVTRAMQADRNPAPSFSVGSNGYLAQDPDRQTDPIGPGLSSADLEEWFGVRLKTLLKTTPANSDGTIDTSTGPFDFRAFLDDQYRNSLEGYPDIFRKTATAAGSASTEIKRSAAAVDEVRQRTIELAREVEGTLGSAFASLFDGPITGLDDALDGILGSFNQLGQQNLSGLFSGTMQPADKSQSWGDARDKIFGAVRDGSREGTSGGFGDFFKNLPAGTAANLGAAAGGLGIGYQTQSPFMGALGGGLAGASGGPAGIAIGAIAGLVGGLLGMNEALEKAKSAVNDNKQSITAFIGVGYGKEIDATTAAVIQYRTQAAEYVKLAQAAGDTALVKRLKEAAATYRDTLKTQNAVDKLQQRFDDARQSLVDAYRDQADEFEAIVDRTRQSISSLTDLRQSLKTDKQFSTLNPEGLLKATGDYFDKLVKTAIGGGEGAASARDHLQAASTQYLDAGRGYLGTSDGYQQIADKIDAALGNVIGAAGTQMSDAQRSADVANKQLERMGEQVAATKDTTAAIKDLARITAAISKLDGDKADKLLDAINRLTKNIRLEELRKPAGKAA